MTMSSWRSENAACHGRCSIRCNWMSGSVTRDNYKGLINPCLNTLGLQIQGDKEYDYKYIYIHNKFLLTRYTPLTMSSWPQGRISRVHWIEILDFSPLGRRPLVRHSRYDVVNPDTQWGISEKAWLLDCWSEPRGSWAQERRNLHQER